MGRRRGASRRYTTRSRLSSSRVSGMSVRKISMSIPEWLEPIIRAAAEHDGMSVSAWLTEAAKTVLIQPQAAQRRRREAEQGLHRPAQLDPAQAPPPQGPARPARGK